MRDIRTKCFEGRSEKTGSGAVAHEGSPLHQIDEAGNRIAGRRLQAVHHAAERRASSERSQILGPETRLTLECIVSPRRTGQGAQQDKLIRDTGELREQFTETDSR